MDDRGDGGRTLRGEMLLPEVDRNHWEKYHIYIDEDNYESKAHKHPELALLLEELIVKDRQQRIPLEEAKAKVGRILDGFE